MLTELFICVHKIDCLGFLCIKKIVNFSLHDTAIQSFFVMLSIGMHWQ
jgi:hypothetical protein